jgi:hypothetical protein
MIRTNLHLPSDMVQRLKLAKQTTGIPVVVMVRQAIDRYLDDLGVAGSSPSTGGEQPVHLKENHHDE